MPTLGTDDLVGKGINEEPFAEASTVWGTHHEVFPGIQVTERGHMLSSFIHAALLLVAGAGGLSSSPTRGERGVADGTSSILGHLALR